MEFARKSFAYNLDRSPISLLPSNSVKTKIVPKAMAQVSFKSAYFEFEGLQQKPYMLFEGKVEAYNTLKNSKEDFFGGVKRVVFTLENRPAALFRYDFKEAQVAKLANASWFECGSDTPPEFLSSIFALIVDNIQVDMLNPNRKKATLQFLKLIQLIIICMDLI
ncbi:hypothetical protein AGMMS49975_26930 [Clostridia bacterium]|nr:hypothetical protein AGMMS49975_26930 [Clostridia bacterium]